MTNFNKKYFLVLGIVLILSISTTIFFIVKENQKQYIDPIPPSANPEGPNIYLGGKTMDIRKKYYINPLEVKVDGNYKEIKTIVINGLKDEKIQSKINDRLKSWIETSNFSVCPNIGNFSNVLSIQCNGEGINFDLTTGNEISIRYLFKDGKYDKTALTNGIYHGLIDYYGYYVDAIDKELNDKLEEYLVQLVKEIENDTASFYVTPIGIYLKNQSEQVEQVFVDFRFLKDDIAIYDRYLTEDNIFQKNPEILFFPLYQGYSFEQDYLYDEYINDFTKIQIRLNDYHEDVPITNDMYEKLKKLLIDNYYVSKNQGQYIEISGNTMNYTKNTALFSIFVYNYAMEKEDYEEFYFSSDRDKNQNYTLEKKSTYNFYVDKDGNVYAGSTDSNKIDKNKVMTYIDNHRDQGIVEDNNGQYLSQLVEKAQYSINEKEKIVYINSEVCPEGQNGCEAMLTILIPLSEVLKES